VRQSMSGLTDTAALNRIKHAARLSGLFRTFSGRAFLQVGAAFRDFRPDPAGSGPDEAETPHGNDIDGTNWFGAHPVPLRG
jgi:hypothetical protein